MSMKKETGTINEGRDVLLDTKIVENFLWKKSWQNLKFLKKLLKLFWTLNSLKNKNFISYWLLFHGL